MSVYEVSAEQKDYFVFIKRGVVKTSAHFHGAIELLVSAKGASRNPRFVILNGA